MKRETSPQPLIQLPAPNGSWIDPSQVVRIQAFATHFDLEQDKQVESPRVVVSIGDTGCELIQCDSWSHAESIRDDLAAKVNAAR